MTTRPTAICGAGVVCALGLRWRGLARGVGEPGFVPAHELALSHPGTLAAEVTVLPAATAPAERRARKLMSRAALLAAVATAATLEDADWRGPQRDTGMYLGVGASGGSMTQLEAMLAVSVDAEGFSSQRFGGDGLRACSPLFAFQLMNNFTLCHGAIAHGIGGPNGAFFSRGSGTVHALSEARYAIDSGTCDQALAGGADSALHPVTWAELLRSGHDGLVPGEGAGLLALSKDHDTALAFVDHSEVLPRAGVSAGGYLDDIDPRVDFEDVLRLSHADWPAGDYDYVVMAPWGPPARTLLADWARIHLPLAQHIDVSLGVGEALAASPALAWLTALDLVADQPAHRALVVSAGIDGDVGVVVISGRDVERPS